MPVFTLYVDPDADSDLTAVARIAEHLRSELAGEGERHQLAIVVNTTGVGMGVSMTLSNRGIAHHGNNPAEKTAPTNYEAVVPEHHRTDVDDRIDLAIGQRLVHPDARPMIHSLVLAAYAKGVCSGPELEASPVPAISSLPGPISVAIVGLPYFSNPNDTEGSGWPARLTGTDRGLPMYQIEGDPNAAAVGRFKASLRAFLGIERR